MKESATFITTIIFLFLITISYGQKSVYYYQIDAGDVNEIHKLASSLNITGLNGWPVSSDELPGTNPNYEGLGFTPVDTTVRNNEQETIYVIHYKLKTIRIDYENFGGSLPLLSFDELVTFDLKFNKITGSMPTLNAPKCQHINLMGNQLTGNIPNMNYPELLYLNLAMNQFSGNIPNFNLPKLVSLFLQDNNFDGNLPSFSLPKLMYLYTSRNPLSGSIPNMNLPELQTLEMEENNLTGNIPNFNFPKAWYIRLTSNQLTGNIPNFNMPELTNLALGNNNLSGEIPTFNMPNLILLNVKNNNLEGTFNNAGLPKLLSLYLQNNLISGLPNLKTSSPDLLVADVSDNKLTFEDLEPNLDISQLNYAGQKQVPCYAEITGTNARVWVEVGGSQNTYTWYKIANGATTRIEDKTGEELIIAHETGAAYRCYISSPLVPNLTIKSEKSKISSCIEVAGFNFCIESGTWEKIEGTNEIRTTNTISINNFLFFSGTMTIDTLSFELMANGEFYVSNFPLPGGGGLGKFVLCEGEHYLLLSEEDEKIKNFLNSVLTKSAELFGVPLRIEEFQFFNREDTFGINLGCSVHIPWLSKGCGNPGLYEPGTDFKLKSLEITNKGIMNVALEAENIGLIKNGYCIKNIVYSYDYKKDVLVGGGEITLPFLVDIGGGFRIEKGYVDSVAWSAEIGSESPLEAYPVGLGTLGIRGCHGHLAGLYEPNVFKPLELDVKLGGTFCDILTDDFYWLKGDSRIKWPKLFEITGELKALKPPQKITGLDLPYQLHGIASGSYMVSENLLELQCEGDFLTLDEQTFLASGRGNLTVDLSQDETSANCGFWGQITIPKLGNYWPFTWFNSLNFGTAMHVYSNAPNIVRGVLYFHPLSDDPWFQDIRFDVSYIINTQKQFYEDGYITFPERSDIFVCTETKSGSLESAVTDSIVIPKNSKFGIIEIKSQSEAPISTITSPAGKIYTTSSETDSIIYSKTEDKKSAFWSILSPEAGTWQISLENPEVNDSVIGHFQLEPNDFVFSMNQEGNDINLNWDVAMLDSGQVINFLFDTDNSGFNGFLITSVDRSIGSATIALNEKYPACSYFLYAQLISENGVVEVYGDEQIENPFNSLLAPEEILATHNVQTGNIDFSWTNSSSSSVAGYIISVIDELGRDSVYAILDSETNSISLFVEDYQNKYALLEPYNLSGQIGCPAIISDLATGIEENLMPSKSLENLMVYPNPTFGEATIRFTLENAGYCEIQLVDFSGRILTNLVSEHYPAGTWEKTMDFANLSNGLYFIVLRSNNQLQTAKIILSN